MELVQSAAVLFRFTITAVIYSYARSYNRPLSRYLCEKLS